MIHLVVLLSELSRPCMTLNRYYRCDSTTTRLHSGRFHTKASHNMGGEDTSLSHLSVDQVFSILGDIVSQPRRRLEFQTHGHVASGGRQESAIDESISWL